MRHDPMTPGPVVQTTGVVLGAAVAAAAAAAMLLAARDSIDRIGPTVAAIGLAVTVVVVFFLPGQIPIRLVGMVGAAGGYLLLGLGLVLRLLLLLVALRVLAAVTWLDTTVLGVSVIACALLWIGVHLVLHLRAARRTPVLDLTVVGAR